LDAAILRQRALRPWLRLRLLASKYRALPRVLRGQPAYVGPRRCRLHVFDVAGIGTWQSCIVDFADEVVAPGLLTTAAPVVVDVGANIGQFCAAVKLFFPSAVLHCFEADPLTYRKLVENTAHLDDVMTYNVALDRTPGQRTFYRHEWSVISSFAPFDGIHYRDADAVTLQTSTLDLMLPDLGPTDLVKIDVEGFELAVVEGGQATLRRSRLLLVEVRLNGSSEPNLALFGAVLAVAPGARLVRTGRPLGPAGRRLSQDMVIELTPGRPTPG
jgi:FkbM family methyltransferase